MKYYQFKITLSDIRPMIWRQVIVPDEYALWQFHHIIQAAMGWENSHLFSFCHKTQIYDDEAGGLSTSLSDLNLSVNDKLHYVYDFGDNWEHVVVLEKILPGDSNIETPICVAGMRACPPEDCGGIWGYQEKLAIAAEKDSPEYAELFAWLGKPLEPNRFDLNEINQRLKEVCLSEDSHHTQ